MRSQKAPLGIRIIAGLTIVGAMLGLPDLVAVMAQSAGVGGLAGAILLGLSGLVLVLQIAQVVVAFGLLRLYPWAWTWSLVVFGVVTLFQGVLLLLGNPLALIEIPINLVMMAYIWTKKDHYRA